MAKACGFALAAAAIVAYRARFIAPYRPVLERVSLPLPPGHEGLAGLRIGFVADTHVGPSISPAQIERALELLAVVQPDLVLFGGDYISDSPRYAERAAALFGRCAATAPLGGIAVLGNHDLANDAERMTDALRRQGIRVLRNESTPVALDGATLWIAGVDESILADACPDAAFAGIPGGAAILALWHEPDGAAASARRGAFAQLSGHSHGGQVRLPFIGAPFAPIGGRRYVSGLNRAAGMPIYTSRGLGTYRPPIRFDCPPEVTLLTLVPNDVSSPRFARREARGTNNVARPSPLASRLSPLASRTGVRALGVLRGAGRGAMLPRDLGRERRGRRRGTRIADSDRRHRVRHRIVSSRRLRRRAAGERRRHCRPRRSLPDAGEQIRRAARLSRLP
ncbi:MAG TPA: metallophosphoesterase [Thermomicrobiales bacterium]|jgi:hypothetical protein|nr:metallophosphoesterase [Thermomicrobiales bacterium]